MKAPNDAVIAGRLRQARAEARITQADAAAALGIPRSAVSALETGDRHLTAVELAKCAGLYRQPAGWFFGDDPGQARHPTALDRLIAGLPRADQDTVIQFAEFLAARHAVRSQEPSSAKTTISITAR